MTEVTDALAEFVEVMASLELRRHEAAPRIKAFDPLLSDYCVALDGVRAVLTKEPGQ